MLDETANHIQKRTAFKIIDRIIMGRKQFKNAEVQTEEEREDEENVRLQQ